MTRKFLLRVACYVLLVVFLVPQPALAQWSAIDPRCETGGVATIQGFECVMRLILNIVVRIAGIAAFVMILAGGFQYLTSSGNQEGTKKAAGTITWGIAGLAILILVWFIMKFITVFTGVDVTQFTIPGP